MKNSITYSITAIIVTVIICYTFFLKNDDYVLKDIEGKRVMIISKSTGRERIVDLSNNWVPPEFKISQLQSLDLDFPQDPIGLFNLNFKWVEGELKFRLQIKSEEKYVKVYRSLDSTKTLILNFYDIDLFPITSVTMGEIERIGNVDEGKVVGVTFTGSTSLSKVLFEQIATADLSWNFDLEKEISTDSQNSKEE